MHESSAPTDRQASLLTGGHIRPDRITFMAGELIRDDTELRHEIMSEHAGKRDRQVIVIDEISYVKDWDKAWDRYVGKRRENRIAKRPVADILIGAFAVGRKGLLIRNADDFLPVFPMLPIGTPESLE